MTRKIGLAFPLSLINTCYTGVTVNDIGDIVDANNSIPQSWTDSRARNSSFEGFLKGSKALNGLGNVIPTTVSWGFYVHFA